MVGGGVKSRELSGGVVLRGQKKVGSVHLASTLVGCWGGDTVPELRRVAGGTQGKKGDCYAYLTTT